MYIIFYLLGMLFCLTRRENIVSFLFLAEGENKEEEGKEGMKKLEPKVVTESHNKP